MTSPRVRAVDIAKLAGVSRAAITQWRKKFPTFPKPVEGADSPSPLFNLNEVERWLVENGRMPEPSTAAGDSALAAGEVETRLRAVGSDEVVIGAYLAAEHLARASAEQAVRGGAAAGLSVPLRLADGTIASGLASVEPNRILRWVRELIEARPELRVALGPLAEQSVSSVGPLQQFIGTLDARFGSDWRTREPDSIFKTSTAGRLFFAPPEYTKFLVDLAGIERGVLLDPCAGWAGTLLEAGRRYRELRLIGVEVNPDAAAIAQQRAILHDLDVDLRVGDSISSDDPATGVVADAVISTPSFDSRATVGPAERSDPRWVFGRPGRDSADRWLQQAVEHLADDGRAVVCTGRLTAEGPQSARLRHELLRRGVIEALISVEMARSGTGTWVWVLARPGRTVDPDRVLMLHAPISADRPDPSRFDEVVGTYRRWRTTGDITPSDCAAAIPVRDLLEPGAELVPQAWIARAAAQSPLALVEEINERDRRRSALAAATPRSLAPLVPVGSAVRTEKLSAMTGVVVLRGTVLQSAQRTVQAAGMVRVMSPDALSALELGASVDEAAPLTVPFEDSRSVRTQTGDIFVGAIRAVNDPDSITVLDVDDWAVSMPSYLVRTDDTLIDRWFLVACIRATLRQPWFDPRTLTGGNLDRIRIPVLPLEEQRRIGRAVRQLDQEQKALARQMQATRHLREAVEGAVASGAITVQAPAQPEPKPRTAAIRKKQRAQGRKVRFLGTESDADD